LLDLLTVLFVIAWFVPGPAPGHQPCVNGWASFYLLQSVECMTSKTKTILAAVGIVGFGLTWGSWSEWPEMMNRDADKNSATRAAAAVIPEKPAPLQSQGKQITYNFDSDPPGQPPANFHQALTGRGSTGKWIIQSDTTAPSKPNVVTQTAADTTDYRFPVLIADEGSFGDTDLSVKFKAVSGHVDQAKPSPDKSAPRTAWS
jgi:hypothetical protein